MSHDIYILVIYKNHVSMKIKW